MNSHKKSNDEWSPEDLYPKKKPDGLTSRQRFAASPGISYDLIKSLGAQHERDLKDKPFSYAGVVYPVCSVGRKTVSNVQFVALTARAA